MAAPYPGMNKALSPSVSGGGGIIGIPDRLKTPGQAPVNFGGGTGRTVRPVSEQAVNPQQQQQATPDNGSQQRYEKIRAAFQQQLAGGGMAGMPSMTEEQFAAAFPENYRLYQNSMQDAQGAYVNTPYGYSQNANWMRPGGDPNAPWASGQDAPMEGVDRRVHRDIFNPGAYEYGGRAGMAESEANRYGSLADMARFEQSMGALQYGRALESYGQGLGMSDAARAQQLQGLGYLQNMAQGNGPTAAGIQMQQGLQAAREQQASFAANARGGGGNLAAAQAMGAQNAGNISMQGIQQAAALRAQEQMGAMQQYGQQAGALRTADYGRAQLAQQQQQLAAGQQQFGASQASQYEQYMQQVRAQQQAYQQSAEQQNLSREAAMKGWNLSQQQMDNAETSQWIQAGTAAGSAILMAAAMSDERSKKEIEDGAEDVDEMLSKLRPKTFKYKPGLGQDEKSALTGIIAQHLGSSKAGAGAVFEGDDGYLRVKGPQAAMLALASAARLHERISKLEKGNARK